MNTQKIKINNLILDWKLWPRSKANNKVDSVNVLGMKECLMIGEKLPFIIVDKKSMKIIDGFHRYYAYMSLYGMDFETEVELRNYKNESEMFIDSAYLNSKHGLQLNGKDKAYIKIRLMEYKIPDEKIIEILGVTNKRSKKILENKIAETKDGEKVPLPRSCKHLGGTILTKKQEKGIENGPIGNPYDVLIEKLTYGFKYDLVLIGDRTPWLLKALKFEIDKILSKEVV